MKILVVDDSAVVRKQIRQELEEGGYEIFEANDGVEAFKSLLSLKPDLITLDVEMPNMNGFETCEKLRNSRYSKIFTTERGTRIPILFLTSDDTLEGRARGFEVGATDFLTKPFKKGALLIAIDNILKQGNILKDTIAVIVEDNELTRSIISDSLKSFGVNTIEVKNGKDAFEIISTMTDKIDMVITDLMMPEMDGKLLCRKIRNELNIKEIPIIILTGMSEIALLLELFEVGATDYIIKPFVKEELLARLNVHLEVRHLNKELVKKVKKLEELDKMKNQFLASCSHDLRSPLSGMILTTQYVLNSPDTNEKNKYFLNIMKQTGEYLYELVSKILDLAALEEDLIMNPTNMSETIESSIKTLKFMALPKNIELTFENRLKQPMILMANELAMKRAINNLLSNAIKFTPKEGKIIVVLDSSTENQLAISVTDTGIGMNENKIIELKKQKKITPGSGTEGEKGSGLGLSIVKEIVEKHLGELIIESKPNNGSSFIIKLPVDSTL